VSQTSLLPVLRHFVSERPSTSAVSSGATGGTRRNPHRSGIGTLPLAGCRDLCGPVPRSLWMSQARTLVSFRASANPSRYRRRLGRCLLPTGAKFSIRDRPELAVCCRSNRVRDPCAISVRLHTSVDRRWEASYISFDVMADDVYVSKLSGGSPECRHSTPPTLLTTPPPEREFSASQPRRVFVSITTAKSEAPA